MKHLGKIEIGGSLDITNNKHVEDLIEEAIQGIDIPEDTNTTYTLTQDGLVVQLVDDGGDVISEIEIPKFEDEDTTYTLSQDGTTIRLVGSEGGSSEVDIASLIPQPVDPYQEVKDIPLPTPTVNLFDTLRSGDYDDFDITSEFDEANDRISIYLHLVINGLERTFTLADNVSNLLEYYNEDGDVEGGIGLVGVSKYTDGNVVMRDEDEYGGIHTLPPRYGGGRGILLEGAAVRPTEDSPLWNNYDGIVLCGYGFNSVFYFVFPDVDYETVSDQQVITGTLEEHLQNIYGHIYNS